MPDDTTVLTRNGGVTDKHEPKPQQPETEVVPRAKRRTFTAAYKLRIVDGVSDADTVISEQFVPRLLEREGAVLLLLTERGRSRFATCLDLVEKQAIGAVDPLGNILDSLAAKLVPERKTMLLLQLSNVLLKPRHVQALTVQAVVSAVQSDTMIPDRGCNLDLPDETPIPLRAVELVFQRLADHRLPVLLVFDVLTDCVFGDVAHRLAIVRTRPERREPALEPWKLLPQSPRCVALELADDLLRRKRRVRLHEQVQVVGHDLYRLDDDAEISGLLQKQFAEAFFDRAAQHLAAILRAPDEVVRHVVDGGFGGLPSAHTTLYAWQPHKVADPHHDFIPRWAALRGL